MTPAPLTRLHLLAYVYFACADIDLNATEDEIRVVIQGIERWCPDEPEKARLILNEAFEWYAAARTEETIPKQINDQQDLLDEFSVDEKKIILDTFQEIAAADGEINDAERNFIRAMEGMLGTAE